MSAAPDWRRAEAGYENAEGTTRLERHNGRWFARSLVTGRLDTEGHATLREAKTAHAGDCYDAAARLLLAITPPPGMVLTLVHGVPTGQGPIAGVRFGHAWVEMAPVTGRPDHAPIWQTVVLDNHGGKQRTFSATIYYEVGRIRAEECVRYDRAQVVQLIARHGHWGPWTPLPEGVA